MNKPRGTQRRVTLNVRIDVETMEAIRELAEKLNISRGQAVDKFYQVWKEKENG